MARAKGARLTTKSLPKDVTELNELLDRTWSDACDAEFARADEEYRTLRASVAVFDAVTSPGLQGLDLLRVPRLGGLLPERAIEFGKRVRAALEGEARLLALDAFEAQHGKIEDLDAGALEARVKDLRAQAAGHAECYAAQIEQTALGFRRLAEEMRK